LKNAVKYLVNDEVVAVGGPGITPPKDNLMQKASGYAYAASFLSSLIGRFRVEKDEIDKLLNRGIDIFKL